MASPKSDDEIRVLAVFKLVVRDLNIDDGTLMRYLRARNLDIKKAESNLRTAMQWKLNSLINNNLIENQMHWKHPDEFLEQFKSCFVCGTDSEQRLVVYIKGDDFLPIRPLFEKFKPMDFYMMAYHMFTLLHERLKSSKHQQVVAITDVAGIGFRKIIYELYNWTGIQTLKEGIHMIELNFPETLYKAFVINTAKAGTWAYNFIKPLIPEQTEAKIRIFGSDKADWLPEIKRALPMEVIPQELGGSNTQLIPIFDFLLN